jgi:membrane protease YdiL (CAAX protease family)
MTSFLDYARRGRTDWWRYLLVWVIAVVRGLFLGVVVLLVLQFSGLAGGDITTEMVKPSHPALFFGANGVVFAAITFWFGFAAWLIQHKRFGDIVGRWSWRLFLIGGGLWLAIQTVGSLVDYALAPHDFRVSAGPGTGVLAVSALLGLGAQTFAEEFVFRGYLTQSLLLALKRPLPAAILSGLIFGSLHIPNGTPQAINAVIFGIVTALIAMRTGGIAFTFGLHMVNNFWGAVVVVSASDVFKGSPGLFTQTSPQLLGWDVAIGAVALAAVGLLVRMRTEPITPRPLGEESGLSPRPSSAPR